MTRGLSLLQRLNVARCANKYLSVTNVILKRLIQKSTKKDTKINQSSASFSNKSFQIVQPNLRSRCSLSADRMEESEHSLKVDCQVEYLDTPVKSENDKKEYRSIKLQNGLTALLISDMHSKTCASKDGDDEKESEDDDEDEEDEESDSEGEDEDEVEEEEEGISEYEEDDDAIKRVKREEKMAACALSLDVGSFSDPPEIPGLAHFLEHMVFMGSEKYPQENDFDAFIIKCGGSDNASTECEQTTFYFDIQEKHLLSALDRFAQFFIKPLMKKDAITREREAVESEFQIALPFDSNRKEQLFCSFARPNHPATKFGWGNLITLRDNVDDDYLYEQLHKFRKRHYSAHRMKLAIQAKLPLDTLEEYVTKCFSDVPNNGLPADEFSEFKGAGSFDTPEFRRIYRIKPIKDICLLELTWAMPPMRDFYKSKPHQYVAWIIGHEGKGSLISYLRKKMWCINVISGNSESDSEYNSLYALFNLRFGLTDEGHKHIEEVLNAIFSYINLMKKEGPHKRIYDEIHQISDTTFRYIDEEQPVDNVDNLCDNMHLYPPCDYITGSELYFEYNPEGIQNCMNLLVPENMNIMIFDMKFDEKKFNKIEFWFKTKYTDTEIPEEWIERWKKIEPLPDFSLPIPNIYLTNDFSLIALPADIPKYPTKIYNDSMSEIWYRPDPKFRLPVCYMNFHLISPLLFESAKNAALADLYVVILKQLLVEELYPAIAADFENTISTTEKGIEIKVNGLSEKLPVLLRTIARYIADYPNLVTKQLFEMMKTQQVREYFNAFINPGNLIKDVRLSILMIIYWTCVDKHRAMCTVNFDEFKSFVESFTKYFHIQCLVQGNMTQKDVIQNVQECINILQCKALDPNMTPLMKIAKIPLGIQTCKLKNLNKTDVNSIVTNYYQAGLTSIELTVIIDLLMMIMEEPLFNQLRTQEQLGYNAFCGFRDTFGILGYSITVYTQANKYTTDHVNQRIEEFLQSFIKILKKLSEEELEIMKDSLMKLKQCADIHLGEEVHKNWKEITIKDYTFDRIEKEVLAIKDIKIDTLLEWMMQHTVNGSNFRKLGVHIVGVALQETENDKINNLEDTKISKDAAENNEKVKYCFEYITDNQESNQTQDNCITNIADYKQQLNIYPLSNTTL